MLARALYAAVALAVLGALPRAGAERAPGPRAAALAAPADAAWTPRAAPDAAAAPRAPDAIDRKPADFAIPRIHR